VKKTLYLICNAHLDPVWLWEWEEGAGEALSTFRSASKLCEEFEEFVFNHNEAVLYKWVEQFEPELFTKLQDLVSRKKWHIMGGWFVQPDCNIPNGESFVRQILIGKRYFKAKFGVEPKTAINFDPFGHTRGLVQILKKSGYSSYLFCRPDPKGYSLPSEEFVWVGYDGSEILARRATEHYNSFLGKARQRVEEWLEKNPDEEFGVLLWGIGNHGGGLHV
jgi:alpha-mannosidase